jgi:hypothetical protein
VIGTLPASGEAAVFPLTVVLLHDVQAATVNTRAASKTDRLDTCGYMAVPPLSFEFGSKSRSEFVAGVPGSAMGVAPLAALTSAVSIPEPHVVLRR